MPMRGAGLDEISRLMGGMETQLKVMNERQQEDRKLHEVRHRENTQNLELISGRVENLERTVSPLATTVEKMQPIVESVLVSRWKLAGALSLAGTLIAGIGWLVVTFIDKLGGWFLAHLPK